MKRTLAMGLVTILALPVLGMAAVFAHGDEDVPKNEETIETTAVVDETDESSDQDKEANAVALEKRLQDRKDQFKVTLSFVQKIRLQQRCKGGQGLISKVKGRFNGIETSRTEVYDNITTHLSNLVTKLKENGVDTTALEANIATLQTKIDTFKTNLEVYKLALSDLVEIDCVQDAEGFQASLEAARTALDKLKTDSREIHDYLISTIKPLLVQIRSQVEAKKEDEEGDN